MIIKIRNQAPGNTEPVREYWLEQKDGFSEIYLLYTDNAKVGYTVYAQLFRDGRIMIKDKTLVI